MIQFTADLHFWHSGIIGACRPWAKDVEHMNATLINQWNAQVDPSDTVYVLGDVSFAGAEKTVSVIGQLHGFIKIVPGNHDDDRVLKKLQSLNMVEVLPPLVYLKIGGERINLCHFPLESWRGMERGAWMLHGHCHGNLKRRLPRRIDVGVDNTVFPAPIPFDVIQEQFAEQGVAVTDHHVPRAKADAKQRDPELRCATSAEARASSSCSE